MRRRVVIRFALVLCVCAASDLRAHHSHPYFYDQCRSLTIEGRVDSVQWVDPHVVVVVRRDDATAYTVDWTGLTGLTRSGTLGDAKAAVVAGARVSVTGNPIRTTAEIRQRFPDYPREVNPNTVDLMRIRRLDDSWSWTRTAADRMPASPPSSCGEPANR